MSDLISSLKRLERAGAETSKTTAKLKSAAHVVSQYVVDLATEIPMQLPRGYAISLGGTLTRTDSSGELPITATREDLHIFAHDIATGWLDDVTTLLDSISRANQSAAASLMTNLARHAEKHPAPPAKSAT